MELYEYERMFKFEDTYWWYRIQREIIRKEIYNLNLKNDISEMSVLDAGCGTGANLIFLKSLGFINIDGFDLNSLAVQYCQNRRLLQVHTENINNLSYNDNSYDLILCMDVFECLEVNEIQALQELFRILKPNGHLILSVAAYQFLCSEHDKAVHSVRRYTKKRLFNLITKTPFHIVKINYFYSFLFIPILFYRMIKKIILKNKTNTPQSDLKNLPFLLNRLLYLIMFMEIQQKRILPLPFGTTLVTVLSKKK